MRQILILLRKLWYQHKSIILKYGAFELEQLNQQKICKGMLIGLIFQLIVKDRKLLFFWWARQGNKMLAIIELN
ncbi:unnamed protein product [Paramecium pentaurelia]|uniref:Uncharacterized protein n=1 Tax=Paramecium pentaurelia TaxID=43138 RepID=A0A8S1XUD5_9CILI|nr:unnamed protein product [Paramecium pentaurelia]